MAMASVIRRQGPAPALEEKGIDDRMAAATGCDQVFSWLMCNPLEACAQLGHPVTADSGRQLPAANDFHVVLPYLQACQVFKEVSEARPTCVGTEIIRFVAGIRTTECGKTGIDGS